MNGLLKNIDKEHAFIYYVTNVDIDKVDGDILIINHEMFKKYNLDATSYHVNEKYWE